MSSSVRDVANERILALTHIATPTSGANVVKVLMLIEALRVPHEIQVVPSPKTDSWFHDISPTKMVPALATTAARHERYLTIFESSSCLQHIVDEYDEGGEFGGRDLWERGQVRNWLTVHTAGLG